MKRGTAWTVTLLAAGSLLLSSCAYYNTFYLAQKYYERGSAGLPYPVEKATGQASNEFRRSIDYSKKLLSQYPQSKWVDDAYLLWARALLGRDDPLQTVNLLEDFNTRFPASSLRNEARFYLGVGYRNARRYPAALAALDTFLIRAPRHALVPYAQLERARALSSLERHAEAAKAASIIIERHGGSGLQSQAYAERAKANLADGAYAEAQEDYRVLGARSRTDDERLNFLLREADCLEAGRAYDRELELLEEALGFEIEPLRPDSGAIRTPQQSVPGQDRFGRILMRVGTVHLLAGRLDEAVDSYRRIVEDYPKTALGAEAQYRVGYSYETLGDDFALARAEYEKVKDQTGATGFGIQALQRAQNLARIEQFRAAASDSTDRRAEGGFILAEQYLFELEKPERAIEEYRRISARYVGTPAAAKALAAEAWVLARKLDRPAAADSLLWKVVREYPATEAQLAARDYLEAGGSVVPESLIKLPEPPPPSPAALVRADSLVRAARADSVARAQAAAEKPPGRPVGATADSLARRSLEVTPVPADTGMVMRAPIDTLLHAPAVRDTARLIPPDPGGLPGGFGADTAPDSIHMAPDSIRTAPDSSGGPPDSSGAR